MFIIAFCLLWCVALALVETTTTTPPPRHHHQQWGGVDWTAMYPRDITILKGKDNLKTTAIRPSSSIRQVYASCCHTPMFRFGGMSVVSQNSFPRLAKKNLTRKQTDDRGQLNIILALLQYS